MRKHDEPPIETVKLNGKAQRELVEQINAARANGTAAEDRRSLRVAYAVPYVDIEITPREGPPTGTQFRVMPLNLSSRGLGFAHGRYVHIGSRCVVRLQTLDEEVNLATGQVISCGHIKGMLHRVGVRFDDLLDLTHFVPLTRAQAATLDQHRMEGRLDGNDLLEQDLGGRALVAGPTPANRELYGTWLQGKGMKVDNAENDEAALQALGSVDIVICDSLPGSESGASLVGAMRTAGFGGPIILATTNTGPEVRETAIAAGYTEVLAQPLTQNRLLRAVARHMLALQEQGGGRVISTFTGDKDWHPLLQRFVAGLQSYADTLAKALEASDTGQLQALCHQVQSAAGNYGFQGLQRAAEATMDALLDPSQEIADATTHLNKLINMLQRAEVAR